MSFGFSISDVAGLGKLAFQTYQNWKSACGEYSAITGQLESLQKILRRVNADVKNPDSLISRNNEDFENLLDIMGQCRHTVTQLNTIVVNHRSLSGIIKSRRSNWDRLKLAHTNYKELFSRLTSHTTTISTYLDVISASSLGRIEAKVDDLKKITEIIDKRAAEMRAGMHEASVWAVHGNDDMETWRLFRRQLASEGFSSATIKRHEKTLIKYLKDLNDKGMLDEEAPPDICNTFETTTNSQESCATSKASKSTTNTSQESSEHKAQKTLVYEERLPKAPNCKYEYDSELLKSFYGEVKYRPKYQERVPKAPNLKGESGSEPRTGGSALYGEVKYKPRYEFEGSKPEQERYSPTYESRASNYKRGNPVYEERVPSYEGTPPEHVSRGHTRSSTFNPKSEDKTTAPRRANMTSRDATFVSNSKNQTPDDNQSRENWTLQSREFQRRREQEERNERLAGRMNSILMEEHINPKTTFRKYEKPSVSDEADEADLPSDSSARFESNRTQSHFDGPLDDDSDEGFTPVDYSDIASDDLINQLKEDNRLFEARTTSADVPKYASNNENTARRPSPWSQKHPGFSYGDEPMSSQPSRRRPSPPPQEYPDISYGDGPIPPQPFRPRPSPSPQKGPEFSSGDVPIPSQPYSPRPYHDDSTSSHQSRIVWTKCPESELYPMHELPDLPEGWDIYIDKNMHVVYIDTYAKGTKKCFWVPPVKELYPDERTPHDSTYGLISFEHPSKTPAIIWDDPFTWRVAEDAQGDADYITSKWSRPMDWRRKGLYRLSDREVPCQMTAEVWDNGLSDAAIAKRGKLWWGRAWDADARCTHKRKYAVGTPYVYPRN